MDTYDPAILHTVRGLTRSGTPWDVHPKPQFLREKWVNLNGTWDFVYGYAPTEPERYTDTVLVPYPPESRLSGFDGHPYEGNHLFFRRSFAAPAHWPQGRVLLHFGAVDQYAEVFLNGHRLGEHWGGYESFSFDITQLLQPENVLKVHCLDDLRSHTMPYGKQVPKEKRGGMWYTPVSGIWQTVWLEWVPQEEAIEELDIQVTLTGATVRITPALSGFVSLEDGTDFPLEGGVAHITPRDIHLWTPETPYLYRFGITTKHDHVQSYFALRTLETKTFDGIPRLCLNGKPYFFHGLLDQGYWPDGIFTPAAPQSFADDILAMKRLGFNTLRKHIKVEPEQFYYECDRLGMVVFQDMVNNGDYRYIRDTVLPTLGVQKLPDRFMHRDKAARQAFLDGMRATVKQLKNHPCICYWTIFNEGWGQFDADRVYPILKDLDSSRFIDSTSGWFRRKKTDVDSRHIYFTPWSALKPSKKPLVLSEFGGYACSIQGHVYNLHKSYGYRTCTDTDIFQQDLTKLYMEKVIPAIGRGLCAAIYTQVSDVEDEINGLLTYDRQVCKAQEEAMVAIARAIQTAYGQIR